ncbi:MAG: hypothetical protein COT17_07135 [Elusimicrobia bacterium CG08_land_8_20_14_0_20_51_18]|nr:MAG: hypothetical protein COT17_07135 [Elusimicrobia bacterium CG08_land_8_20_14_0_20_51_18]
MKTGEKVYDAVIAGAGASGLMAAFGILSDGAEPLLLEKNPSPGRKILSTGAGKCNLSNENISPEKYHCDDRSFLERAFSALPPAEIIRIFNEDLGLLTKTGEAGKIFPYSEKAESVLAAFGNFLEKNKAASLFLFEITGAEKKDGLFRVHGETRKPNWVRGNFKSEKLSFLARKLILSCGGPSYPQLGGGETGYALAESFGHSVKKPRTALVPLTVREKDVRELAGVRLDCALKFEAPGENFGTGGELLFTDYGLSGPAALDAGRKISELAGLKKIKVLIDLMPRFSPEKLGGLLSKRAGLSGMLDPKLENYILRRAGPPKGGKTGPPLKLAALIKGLDFEISGTKGFSAAMTKAGGVPVSEADPSTFESLREKGLYLTGETLDVDGESGGYNLHFAWTSGLLAGRAM